MYSAKLTLPLRLLFHNIETAVSCRGWSSTVKGSRPNLSSSLFLSSDLWNIEKGDELYIWKNLVISTKCFFLLILHCTCTSACSIWKNTTNATIRGQSSGHVKIRQRITQKGGDCFWPDACENSP